MEEGRCFEEEEEEEEGEGRRRRGRPLLCLRGGAEGEGTLVKSSRGCMLGLPLFIKLIRYKRERGCRRGEEERRGRGKGRGSAYCAHWKGSLHLTTCSISTPHSSCDSGSPNITAPENHTLDKKEKKMRRGGKRERGDERGR